MNTQLEKQKVADCLEVDDSLYLPNKKDADDINELVQGRGLKLSNSGGSFYTVLEVGEAGWYNLPPNYDAKVICDTRRGKFHALQVKAYDLRTGKQVATFSGSYLQDKSPNFESFDQTSDQARIWPRHEAEAALCKYTRQLAWKVWR